MKKLVAILATLMMVLTMLLSLTACGDESSSENSRSKRRDKKDSKSVSDTSDDDDEDSYDDDDEDSYDDDYDYDYDYGSDSDITINETVLVDQGGVKVTATKLKTEDWGDLSLNLLVENTSSYDVYVRSSSVIVNNYQIDEYFWTNVSAGKKSNDSVYLISSVLKEAGVETVGQIEMSLYAYYYDDNDDYVEIFETDLKTLSTSAFSEMDTIATQDMGMGLYNASGITVYGKYVKAEEDYGYDYVLLFVENKTGKNVVFDCTDFTVNDFEIYDYIYDEINNNKTLITMQSIQSSDLEDNDIDTVEKVGMSFEVRDQDSYDTIVKIPEILLAP